MQMQAVEIPHLKSLKVASHLSLDKFVLVRVINQEKNFFADILSLLKGFK